MSTFISFFVRPITLILYIYCLLAVVILVWPLSAWLTVLIVIVRWRYRRHASPTDLGNARWAEERELCNADLLGSSSGLILGRLPLGFGTFRLGRAPLVRLPHAVHTAIIGPTGAGKGVSFVIPTLLTNPESMVVLDFKGELARAAAEYRREHFGHRVVLLDPYHSVTPTPDSLNPLDTIDKGDALAIDSCNDLAASLVVRTGQEREKH